MMAASLMIHYSKCVISREKTAAITRTIEKKDGKQYIIFKRIYRKSSLYIKDIIIKNGNGLCITPVLG